MNFSGTIRCTRLGIILTSSIFFFLVYFYMHRNSEIFKRDITVEAGTSNLKDILISSIEVAELAGKEIVKIHENADLEQKSKGKTLEGVDDPVTKADLISHCIMYHSLQHKFPKLKIISEEKINGEHCTNLPLLENKPDILGTSSLENHNEPNEDITIWIDPLDATKEYTENKVQYVSTMVCIAVKGKPVIGVIHFPFDDGNSKTLWAWVGKDKSKNLLSNKEPEKPTFIISMSHAGDVKKKLETFGAEVISAAGSGYKIRELINGKASIYYHATNIKKWDICAGDAMLHAFDSQITTFANQPISYSPQDDFVVKDGLLACKKPQKWYWDHIDSLKKVKT